MAKKTPTQEIRFGSYLVRTAYDDSAQVWITELLREHEGPTGPHHQEIARARAVTRKDAVLAHDQACEVAHTLFLASLKGVQ
jgi:hypothetical protein